MEVLRKKGCPPLVILNIYLASGGWNVKNADPLKSFIKNKKVICIEQSINHKPIMWVLQREKSVGPPSENESHFHKSCINDISDVDS